MQPIPAERLAALMDALPDLYAPCELDLFPAKLLAVTRQVVQSDGNAYNEVNTKLRRAIGMIDQPDWPMEKLVGPLEAHMHEHPVILHCMATRNGSAMKISDFLSHPELQRTGLYNELYRPLSVKYQMSITIPTPTDEIVAVVVNRCQCDFDETDRAVLNMLRPHIAQAYQSAVALTDAKRKLRQANSVLERIDEGLVVVSDNLKIVFATRSATQTMTSFFGPRARSRDLPKPLHDWLVETLRCAGRSVNLPREPLRVFAGDRWLLVRLLGNAFDGKFTLVFQQQASATSAVEKLRPLGLTPREAEALYWVAQGKTNPEIAQICGLSPRTVQKHIEHIFQKLEVQSRTAAAFRARELL